VGSPKKPCKQVSKQGQLITFQYVAINNHKLNVHAAKTTHIRWTRAKSNMPLVKGPAASQQGSQTQNRHCGYKLESKS
jgi:hypothetical protein